MKRAVKISTKSAAKCHCADGRDCRQLLLRNDPFDGPYSGLYGTVCIRGLTFTMLNVYASWRTMGMRSCTFRATAAIWTICCCRTFCTTRAGSAAHRSRYQPEFLASGSDFPSSGRILYSSYLQGQQALLHRIPRIPGELFSRGYSVEYFVEVDVHVLVVCSTRKPAPCR